MNGLPASRRFGIASQIRDGDIVSASFRYHEVHDRIGERDTGKFVRTAETIVEVGSERGDGVHLIDVHASVIHSGETINNFVVVLCNRASNLIHPLGIVRVGGTKMTVNEVDDFV